MSDCSAWPAHTGDKTTAAIEAAAPERWMRGQTMSQMLDHAAHAFGEALAHRFLSDPHSEPIDQTYQALHQASDNAARHFARFGDTPVVASLLPGLPATLPLAFAAMRVGIFMPVNPMLAPDTIGEMLARAGASILLICADAVDDGCDPIVSIKRHCPDLAVIAVNERTLAETGAFAGWSGIAGLPPPPQPDDIAAYFHTGGTTGAPKIARLTHRNLAFMAFLAAFGGGMRKGDVLPCGMPLFHVGGLIFGGLAPLAAGARIVQLGRDGFRDLGMRTAFAHIANRQGATVLFAPPTIALDVLQTTEPRPFNNARHWVSSAAPLAVATHRAFTEHTGLAVKEAWGLTEATLVLTFTPPHGATKAGSVGPRLPYCELAVVDLHKGSPLPTGETGLILARSPGLFAGYLGADDDGLIEGFDGRRWLDTGDLGHIDEDGYVTITGRAKDMILRGGHNIDPSVIEDAFLALPEITAAAAIGKPDRRVGELPVVFLTPARGATLDVDTTLASANAAIPDPVARPREAICLEQMPVTAIGKIDRPALRREAVRRAVCELVGPQTQVRVFSGTGGAIDIVISPYTEADAEMISALGLNPRKDNQAR